MVKNLKKVVIASTLLAAFTGKVYANGFTTEQLHAAAKVGTETFKLEYGAAFHESIYGIQSTKGASGSKVKLFYKQNNQNLSIEYFCHFHEGEEIDCHEH
jgi:hypothetical protein